MNVTVETTSPFAPLILSHHDANYLKELVHTFVQQQVRAYERYLHDDQERLDKNQWKEILHRDNMRVFSQLQTNRQNEKPGDDARCINLQQPSELANSPTLLTVGHMDGSLDDAMYGAMTPTVASMRLKGFHTEDHLAKGAVLATIDSPSATDPFQSLNVKYAEGYLPLMVRPIVSNRDFVYMEATGFTKLHDDETVGYHLLHSVHFPQTPNVGNNIRGAVSICGLYRQRNYSTVEVYARASLISGGRVARHYTVRNASIALASARKMVHCARLKKLAWLLKSCDATAIRGKAQCIGCGRKPGIFATDIGSCSLCKRALCSSCRAKIELGFATTTGSLVKRKLWFCTYCLDEAGRTSARDVALEEYVNTRLLAPTLWSNGPTNSSSPSNSDRSNDCTSVDSRYYVDRIPR